MRRIGVCALLAALAAAGGCAAPARYVEKKADSGVVAVPNNSDSWPSNNRTAALALIEKHVGPNYEITDERTVPTGRAARTALPDTNEPLNPRNAAYPAKRPTTAATAQDAEQYQIAYRRAAWPAPRDLRSQEDSGLTPGVRPAGGPLSAFNRPAPATGGADCNH